jgi:hypothetical protein
VQLPEIFEVVCHTFEENRISFEPTKDDIARGAENGAKFSAFMAMVDYKPAVGTVADCTKRLRSNGRTPLYCVKPRVSYLIIFVALLAVRAFS